MKSNEVKPEPKINKALDGLRGVAAFSVVIVHFFAAFLPATLHHHDPTTFQPAASGSLEAILGFPLFSVFYNGQFAVCIFFVLSGYVLALPYWRDNELKIKKRLWARYLRLYLPTAAAILISYILLNEGFYFHKAAAQLSQSKWLITYLNFQPDSFKDVLINMFWGSVNGDTRYNPPIGTLRVEFIGSVFLLAYFAIKPYGRNIATTAIILPLLLYYYGDLGVYYVSIILGAYLYHLKVSFKTQIALFAVGLYLGSFVYEHWGYDYLPGFLNFDRRIMYCSLGSVLLVGAVINGLGNRFLQTRFCQFLGRQSFAVYLLHFLVIYSFSSYLYVNVSQEIEFLALNLVLTVILSYALAYAFEKLIDQNSIRVSHALSNWLFKKK